MARPKKTQYFKLRPYKNSAGTKSWRVLSDAGLVHRDVKPDNILFLDGRPCLADISLLREDAHIAMFRRWIEGGLPDFEP